MKQLEIDVVAAILTRGNLLLLAQRDNSRDQAGLWEFPGGKVEPEETQPEALCRELVEELGIDAKPTRYIANTSRQVGERLIRLHAWHVADFTGEPQMRCHYAFHWVTPAEARHYPLAPADIPLLEAFIELAII